MSIKGRTSSYPKIRMKQFHFFDMDAMAARTKYFSIPADNPSSRCGKVQVSNFSLNLTVDAGSFLAAFLTDRSKASVGFRLYKGFGCFRGNVLSDNFYSTKRKIMCYGKSGHRRPPLDKVFFRKSNLYPLELPDVHSCLKLFSSF